MNPVSRRATVLKPRVVPRASVGLASRRELVMKLIQRQAQIAQKHPHAFAANRIAKALSTSHAPGQPVRTATVYYDKANATTGRALEREFAKRGVKTEARGLIGSDAQKVQSPEFRKDLRRTSRAEAVVFLVSGRGLKFDKTGDTVIAQAEQRQKTKRGTRLAFIYGVNNRRDTRVLAATAQQSRLMRRFTRKTFAAVREARRVQIKTPNGTNLNFSLSPRRRWIIDEGIITKNYWGNLPAGEVTTAPMRVDGTAVLDGFVNGIGNVERTPITAQVRTGRVDIRSVTCANPKIRQKFIQLLQEDKNGGRIGELGLGTNVSINQVHEDVLINEKTPGVHIAFGDPMGAETGAKWESEVHNDATIKRPTIIVDGRIIMRQGQSLLK